jgi:2-dehydro-3-deoxyphosphooctonate aldolase (KDO 8-P synthase)
MSVSIGKNKVGNNLPLTLIAGPCVIESLELAQEVAGSIAEIATNGDTLYI